MKFKISAASCWSTEDFLLKYGRLLQPWGLEIEKVKKLSGSGVKEFPVVYVDSFDSLGKLQLAVGNELIFDFKRKEVIIYDYYIE